MVAAVSKIIFSTVSASLRTGAVQVISPTVLNRTVRFSTFSPALAGVNSVTGTIAPPF